MFQQYTGGVITRGCANDPDTGVLVVGWGTDENNQEYFRIKNAWSAAWGDAGYAKIAPDQCGILKYCVAPKNNN